MAGGNFDPNVPKVLPGTYINFKTERQNTLPQVMRGTALLPLAAPTYGPEFEYLTLTNDDPDKHRNILGYSIFDPELITVREAFKNAKTVIVYPFGGGTKATATLGDLKATAMCGGTRGNDFNVVIVENILGGFDVLVYLKGSLVEKFERVETVEDVILHSEAAKGKTWLDYSGEGSLAANAGTSLEGGEDAPVSNSDVLDFVDKVNSVKFDSLAFPFGESALKAAIVTKIISMNTKGIECTAAVPNYNGNSSYIINVTNSVEVDGTTELTTEEVTAWVAGATAGAEANEGITYNIYQGATKILNPKDEDEAIAAVKNGEFFFTLSEEDEIVVCADINSLTDFDPPNGEQDSDNRVIRGKFYMSKLLKSMFRPGRNANNTEGWDIMDGIAKTVLKDCDDKDIIFDVDYENDLKVDRAKSSGKHTHWKASVKWSQNSDKHYFEIITRTGG